MNLRYNSQINNHELKVLESDRTIEISLGTVQEDDLNRNIFDGADSKKISQSP